MKFLREYKSDYNGEIRFAINVNDKFPPELDFATREEAQVALTISIKDLVQNWILNKKGRNRMTKIDDAIDALETAKVEVIRAQEKVAELENKQEPLIKEGDVVTKKGYGKKRFIAIQTGRDEIKLFQHTPGVIETNRYFDTTYTKKAPWPKNFTVVGNEIVS